MNMRGSRIVVTGAASGVGLAFVGHSAGLGARVWALDRDEAWLRKAQTSAAEGVRTVLCDVSEEPEAIAAIAGADAEADGVDVLVNVVPVPRGRPLVSKDGSQIRRYPLADWKEMVHRNLTGLFLMTREAAAAMILRRIHGLIVNVSWISGNGNNAGMTAYSATRTAIEALTLTWSGELAAHGIRVVAIAPGVVGTPASRRIPPLFQGGPHDVTLPRCGSLDEFARTIQYAIETDYLNGRVLELDGELRL